eukprot:g3380.t1
MLCRWCLSFSVALLAIVAGFVRFFLFEELEDPYPTPEFQRQKYSCEILGDKSDGVNCARERAPHPHAKVFSMAYPIIGRTDESIGDTQAFFKDFGLAPLWTAKNEDAWVAGDTGKSGSAYYWRCRGSRGLPCVQARRVEDPNDLIIGFAFDIHDESGFNALAALPYSKTEDVKDARGGGKKVILTDPDGLIVEVRYGFGEITELFDDEPERPEHNGRWKNNRDADSPRHLARKWRPPPIAKIMHCAFHPRNVLKSLKWYQDHFGFIVSDFLYPATKKYRPTPLGTFLRTDLGDEPSDHHTFFMLAIPADEPGELDHCAFEVRDYDDVAEGHRYLAMKAALGRKYSFGVGVGRHMLGGQIYDYWREPVQHMWEHACDSDRMTSSYPTGYNIPSSTGFGSIGEVVTTEEFVDPNRVPGRLLKLIKRMTGTAVMSSPDDDFSGLDGARFFINGILRGVLNGPAHNEVPVFREWKETQSKTSTVPVAVPFTKI